VKLSSFSVILCFFLITASNNDPNLNQEVFTKTKITVNSLLAEIRGPKTIWAKIVGNRPLTKSSYKLTDATGIEIPIASVLPNTASETLIIPRTELDIKRVYFLEIPNLNLKAFCSFDGWFRELYSEKELGANIGGDKNSTSFRVFAPRAEQMRLYLYKEASNDSTQSSSLK